MPNLSTREMVLAALLFVVCIGWWGEHRYLTVTNTTQANRVRDLQRLLNESLKSNEVLTKQVWKMEMQVAED